MKKAISTLLICSLMLLVFAGCAKNSDDRDAADTSSKTEYADIEEALVGEAKSLAVKIARFAATSEVSLMTSSPDILDVVSRFSDTILSNKTPVSATRYIIDADSLEGEARISGMTKEEWASLYSTMYPISVSNSYGEVFSVAMSILAADAAYPLPKGFSGVQIIELWYSSDIGVFAVFCENKTGTITCTAYPMLFEKTDQNSFEKFISSAEWYFDYKIKSCSAKHTATLSDCKPSGHGDALPLKNLEINIAKDLAPKIAVRANRDYLDFNGTPEAIYEYCLACSDLVSHDPVGAIVWSAKDIDKLYGPELSFERMSELMERRMVRGFASYLCGQFGGDTLLASQATVAASGTYLTKGSPETSFVLLMYEEDDIPFGVLVCITPVSDGCVSASASPMWSLPMVVDAYAYYVEGVRIDEYDSALNSWLMSGEYFDFSSGNSLNSLIKGLQK